ncbi:MAG: hypothetical protein AAFY88_27355, partial [Acidobacteriota bacterium]
MKRLTIHPAGRPWLCVAVTAAVLIVSSAAFAAPPAAPPVSFQKNVGPLNAVPMRTAPPPDLAKAWAEDATRELNKIPAPYRFAIKTAVDYRSTIDGTWTALDDGSRLWRLRVTSPGALSMILTFDKFSLADGASFWVYSQDGSDILGPYSPADAKDGRFWTPLLKGDLAVVELHEPAASVGQSEIAISDVSHGYRGFFDAFKQGSCNIDTVCSEANAWRDEVRSIVMYTLNGIDRCTGVMVNNTAEDAKPYMLTAEHCSFSGSYPDVTTYFNFESPTCGALSGGVRNQSVNGATLRAIDEISDYALLELDSSPPAEFGAYFSGWDISDTAMPSGVAAIHHPSVDEKAISFENDPVQESPDSDPWPSTHW